MCDTTLAIAVAKMVHKFNVHVTHEVEKCSLFVNKLHFSFVEIPNIMAFLCMQTVERNIS